MATIATRRGHRSWALPQVKGMMAFWAVAGIFGVVMVGSTLQTPLYVIYQQQLGFSQIALTLIYCAYVVGSLIALIFAGRLSDQIGRRTTMIPGMVGAIVATVIFLCVVNTGMLYVARGLFGLSVGVIAGTATAWLTELHPRRDHMRASLTTVVDNLLALAIGPVVAGALAQYAPMPTRLVYLLYLPVLLLATAATWAIPETVKRGKEELSLRPRLGVPKEVAAEFIAPAAGAFAIFALGGFFSALSPTFLSRQLRQHNHAVAGAVVTGLYFVSGISAWLLKRVKSQTALFLGLVVLLPAVALMVLAMPKHSMWVFLSATLLGGVSMGSGYKGSLEAVNQIAPGEQRAEVLSAYFLVVYIGVAIPVVGIGVISQLVDAFIANLTFAIVVAVIAILGLAAGIVYPPKDKGR